MDGIGGLGLLQTVAQEGPTTNMTQTMNFADVSIDVAFGLPRGDFLDSHPSVGFSGVQHDTGDQVDDTGTLLIGGTTEGLQPAAAPPTVNLELSHPFFYTIRDNQTGALLFTGIAMNPNAG
jgi:serine protease inhibitor